MGTLEDHRNVINFDSPGFVKMPMPGLPDEDVWWKNISYDETAGQGSYLMIMAPGTRCNPHRHNGPEEFYVVEGDLEDCDGHMYRAGDFVSLSGGSAHYSISHSGCRLVVTHRGVVDDLTQEELEET